MQLLFYVFSYFTDNNNNNIYIDLSSNQNTQEVKTMCVLIYLFLEHYSSHLFSILLLLVIYHQTDSVKQHK